MKNFKPTQFSLDIGNIQEIEPYKRIAENALCLNGNDPKMAASWLEKNKLGLIAEYKRNAVKKVYDTKGNIKAKIPYPAAAIKELDWAIGSLG